MPDTGHSETHPDGSLDARRYPSTIGGVVYIALLLTTLAGVAICWLDSWRRGAGWIGASLVAAAVARLVFTDADAGMLKVRGRAVDSSLLAATGTAVVLLAGTIPNQPGT